jgi:hypothetical protein
MTLPCVCGPFSRGRYSLPVLRPRLRDRWIRLVLLIVAWMVPAGILIAVGMLVKHSAGVPGFDNHVTSFVVAHRTAGLNEAMKAVTWLGSWVAVVVVAGLVLLLVLRPPAVRRVSPPGRGGRAGMGRDPRWHNLGQACRAGSRPPEEAPSDQPVSPRWSSGGLRVRLRRPRAPHRVGLVSTNASRSRADVGLEYVQSLSLAVFGLRGVHVRPPVRESGGTRLAGTPGSIARSVHLCPLLSFTSRPPCWPITLLAMAS